jgi:16S rRNA (adenine1518-N6/adenine1519-N6)-dimethyltransferase
MREARGARAGDPHRTRKRFGQNFLEPAWVAKVVAAIAPQAGETFVEIGPGRGALTRPLAAGAGQVIAIEIDRDLAADLRESMPPNVRIVETDFLDLRQIPTSGPVRVAGNLPYNVASPILFRLVDFFDSGAPLVDATVMLQREVADRLLAEPGTRDYSTLTVLIRYDADVTRLLNLPPGAFRPAPKVESTLVRLRFRPPASAVRNRDMFRRLVQGVFTQRRKTLVNALKPLVMPDCVPAVLSETGIDGRRRGETLSIREFGRLADAVELCYSKSR